MTSNQLLMVVVLCLCVELRKGNRVMPETNHGCIDWSDEKAECKGGCTAKYRGRFCNKTCSENCGGAGACSQDTGDCLAGCKPNWFTSNCSVPCSGHCQDNICDQQSGECLRGCQDGYYRPNCSMTCSEKCIGGKCNIYGGCNCQEGVTDPVCYMDCSENCIGGYCAVDKDGQVKCLQGCKQGRTGAFCKEWCPVECAECDSDGACTTNTRTKRNEGHCIDIEGNGRCSCCEDKWRGEDCDIQCTGCRYAFRNCTRTCAGGFFGEECHIRCPDHCTRAINGRSGCDKRGLCHSGCLQGHYGYVCDRACPETCDSRYCFMNNGSCSIGCVPGKWGAYCENTCGHCVDLKCKRDGTCPCVDGYYGPRCEDICTDHCQSGICSINMNGSHVCDGHCVPGYTGAECLSKCPPACAVCDRFSGFCSSSFIKDVTQTGNELPTWAIVLIVAVAVAVILIIVIVIMIVVCYKRNKYCFQRGDSPPSYNESQESAQQERTTISSDSPPPYEESKKSAQQERTTISSEC